MSRTSRRTGLGALVAALVLLGVAVPAWAYFSVSSAAATAAGAAAALGTPSVATSGVTSATVTFTVTAPTSGPSPTGYRVARTAPTTVSTVCTVNGANGTCTDTAPVSGQTNTYAVYAVLAGTSWESPTAATTSVAVPSADTTAPVTIFSQSPAPNGAGWNTTDVVVTLTATDASGVAGTWYTTDGTAPTTSATTYTGAFTLSAGATVRYFSRDTIGNAEDVKSALVQIDKTAPAVALTSPAASSVNGGSVSVSGTASDAGPSALAPVVVQYQPSGAGSWTTIASPTATNGTWSTPWATAALADGTYLLRAVATDVAGNTTTSPTVSVTLKNTFTVTAPGAGTAGTAFNVTVSTYPGYTGTKSVAVTGLLASPSGTTATVPTSATFTNGTATISVTPVKSGSQTITVTDTALTSVNGTSAAVNISAGAAARVAWTTFTAQGQVQPASACYFACTAIIGNNVDGVGVASLTDAQGNIVSDVGAGKSIVVSAPTPTGGSPTAAQALNLPAAGPATSATQWRFKDNGNWAQYTFTATSTGMTQATLTVKKQ